VWVWTIAVVGWASAAVARPGEPPPLSTVTVSPQGLDHVATLARAAALVRYLHPSDQTAALDWNAFLPGAIDRALRAPDRAALLVALRDAFAAVAPTVGFAAIDAPPATPPLRFAGTHLARWRRYASGPPAPYPSFREGRDDESDVAVSEVIAVPLAAPERCGTARINAEVRRRDTGGTSDLVVRLLRGGQEVSEVPWPISRDGGLVFSAPVTPDTRAIELGVQIDGRAGVTLEALSLRCASGELVAISPAAPGWQTLGPSDLTTWRTGRCGSRACATLARNPLATAFVLDRDLMSADIGSGVRIDLPLAVWADDARTLPVPIAAPAIAAAGASPADALLRRLAAVAAAWGALATFYPYFADQHIDWVAALSPALAEAAAARDAGALRVALLHLLGELHDGHARLSDPALPSGGILPVALRRFGDRIVVTGGAAEYLTGIAAGSELVALDGVPALAAYDRAAALVSAATAGLRAHRAAARLGAGPPGATAELVLRSPDGGVLERHWPLLPGDRYDHAVRPRRPWPGTELAPGVIYVDFDALAPETWSALLPVLARARALVFDFRGYSTTGLVAASHLIDRPVEQLTWQLPQLPADGRPAFAPVRRVQYPIAPRLAAPVIALVDGQSASTVETTLALLRDRRLATLIGEPTAGASGLIASFPLPGGEVVRFTAIRLAGRDGSSLHGRGLVPDRIVRPTLDGVRAGRDEILEAGLAAAQQLVRDSRATLKP
jgi:hypothetical protein